MKICSINKYSKTKSLLNQYHEFENLKCLRNSSHSISLDHFDDIFAAHGTRWIFILRHSSPPRITHLTLARHTGAHMTTRIKYAFDLLIITNFTRVLINNGRGLFYTRNSFGFLFLFKFSFSFWFRCRRSSSCGS